jgi:hypothetical protein
MLDWTKIRETSISIKKAVYGGMHLSTLFCWSINRRVSVQAHLGKTMRPYFKKITKPIKVHGMAQVVERWPSKHKTLSSNLTTTHTHTKGIYTGHSTSFL